VSDKARILIVDDEPEFVANWRRILERDGYACITATNGERAIALLEANAPRSS
jgi:CheY-like chemotaxis protein